MFGFVYLLLSFGTGKRMTEAIYLKKMKKDNQSSIWILLPAAFCIGTLVLTWCVYLVSWLWESRQGSRHPLFVGNLAVMGIAGLWLLWGAAKASGKKRRIGERVRSFGRTAGRRPFLQEGLYFLCLALFLTGIFFYVFFISGDRLYAGVTVFSDYAPHTAMMRSFSAGNNFPTQYPHFGGEDVKYHFMFQFLTGNLEYLGMRLDLAYNLVSMFSLLGMLMLLYRLTLRFTGSVMAGFLSGFLFFFRSGLAFFRFLWEHWRAGDVAAALAQNETFLGYTQSENWGLWCFNVYLNQRHLAFGILLAELLLWKYADWLEESDAGTEKGALWLKNRFLTKNAWICRDLRGSLLAGILLGMGAFWNGAAVIGGLLILAGFAVFSDHKLDYLVMAVCTILLSLLQAAMFIRSSDGGVSLYWGLLAEDKSLQGVLWYLFQISGVFFLGLIFVVIYLNRLQRMALCAFLVPLLFAFTVSLTPDITVNHKYVMISYVFVTIFWACALARLWKKGWRMRLVSGLLAAVLTLTGIYDFFIILRNNGQDHRISVDLQDDTLLWLENHLSSTDLILTPAYALNEVTMAGVMMYCGWPYYAWSAGYDTDIRYPAAKQIYTSGDRELVEQLVKEAKVHFLLYDARESYYDDQMTREDVIAECYPLVFENREKTIRIYRTARGRNDNS